MEGAYTRANRMIDKDMVSSSLMHDPYVAGFGEAFAASGDGLDLFVV